MTPEEEQLLLVLESLIGERVRVTVEGTQHKGRLVRSRDGRTWWLDGRPVPMMRTATLVERRVGRRIGRGGIYEVEWSRLA
jgi:hypothetical protein